MIIRVLFSSKQEKQQSSGIQDTYLYRLEVFQLIYLLFYIDVDVKTFDLS